jgi:hypothetical protein
MPYVTAPDGVPIRYETKAAAVLPRVMEFLRVSQG